MNCSVTIYDHTDIHLIQAKALNYQACGYDLLMSKLGNFDIIINTVPCAVFYEKHYAKINKNCILFEVASHPFGFNKELAHKYNLSLITCPGIPGIKSPKTAGELIAKSIISYVERTEINGS
jgi:dipicolinate synthase subunit A